MFVFFSFEKKNNIFLVLFLLKNEEVTVCYNNVFSFSLFKTIWSRKKTNKFSFVFTLIFDYTKLILMIWKLFVFLSSLSHRNNRSTNKKSRERNGEVLFFAIELLNESLWINSIKLISLSFTFNSICIICQVVNSIYYKNEIFAVPQRVEWKDSTWIE